MNILGCFQDLADIEALLYAILELYFPKNGIIEWQDTHTFNFTG